MRSAAAAQGPAHRVASEALLPPRRQRRPRPSRRTAGRSLEMRLRHPTRRVALKPAPAGADVEDEFARTIALSQRDASGNGRVAAERHLRLRAEIANVVLTSCVEVRPKNAVSEYPRFSGDPEHSLLIKRNRVEHDASRVARA